MPVGRTEKKTGKQKTVPFTAVATCDSGVNHTGREVLSGYMGFFANFLFFFWQAWRYFD
jgi:hypothetical protein